MNPIRRKILILLIGPIFLSVFFFFNISNNRKKISSINTSGSHESILIDSAMAADDPRSILILPYIRYYHDVTVTADTSIDQIFKGNFQSEPPAVKDRQGTLWKKLVVSSATQSSKWYLGTSSIKTTYYLKVNRAPWIKGQIGTDVLNEGDMYKVVANPFIPLNIPASSTVTLLWHHEGFNQNIVSGNNQLWRFANKLVNKSFIYQFHIKRLWQILPPIFILLAISIYHIVLFLFNRHKIYLLLGLSALSSILLITHDNDLMLQWFEIRNMGSFASIYFPTIYILNLIVIPFTISFLELSKKSITRIILIHYVVIAIFAWAGFFFIYHLGFTDYFPRSFFKTSLGILFLSENIILFILSIWEIIRGNRNAIYFFAAYGTVFAGYVATLLWAFGFFALENATYPTAVGFLLFSISLAQKFRTLEDEQMEAQESKLRAEYERDQKTKEAIKLREIDQLKNHLYTNISHEFRTPLTLIMGMARQMEDYPLERELILRNTQQLLNLVNQMLELQKIDSGHLKPDFIQSDIVPHLHYLCESYRYLAESQNKNFNLQVLEDSLWMDYDPNIFERILNNLVSNALKFTTTDGSIYLRVGKISTGNECVITVKDTGKGISQDHLDKIFDRFYQVDNTTTRTGEGTGIGLALVKELVDLLGGEVLISSTLGAGAIFTVKLPIYQNKPISIWDPEKTILTSEAFEQPLPEQPPSKDEVQVLIIDDNPDIRYYLKKILIDKYSVIESHDGKHGLIMATNEIPDIIISDIMMPEMDGLALSEHLKNDDRTSHIPIILLTAKSKHDDRLDGLNSGADAYLVKPFDQDELMVLIQNLFLNREKSRLYYQKHLLCPTPLERENNFLQKAKLKIEENFSNEDFTVDVLAKEFFLSRTQIFRKLKSLTGKSFTEIVKEMKIHRAKELLINTDKTVAEIAFDLGFKDAGYFSKTFKATVKERPLEFRSKQT